jgi:F-type H+-transporting ATPase subunit delta
MKYSVKQYAEALYDSVGGTHPKDQEKVLDNFVKILVQNNDLRLFDQIADEFHKLELAAKGKTQAEVTSAEPLTPHSEKQLIEQLNHLVKGDVELKKKVDKDLIGGVVVRLEDTVIDASVKRNLEDLKNNLTKQ